ncbi:hypothetical protein AGR8A_pAt30122 [Agrobacterium fabrum str. J-07]|nr:hypothetical protein AGR8A_pAt30122 [Agrobacterium fabrum str. J-07]
MSNIIGITMGDPCGVGPEITVRALAEMDEADRAATRIYGNLPTLEAARKALNVDIDLAPYVVDLPIEDAPLAWGQLSPVAGDAAFRFIEKAVRDAEAGTIGCIVTAPINKEALNLAGHHYDGHTGMLRSLTKSAAAYMLLAYGKTEGHPCFHPCLIAGSNPPRHVRARSGDNQGGQRPPETHWLRAPAHCGCRD